MFSKNYQFYTHENLCNSLDDDIQQSYLIWTQSNAIIACWIVYSYLPMNECTQWRANALPQKQCKMSLRHLKT